MRCNQCKQNPATVELHLQMNNRVEHLRLCRACYRKVKSQMKFPAGMAFGGSSPFDELFRHMMGPQSSGMNPQFSPSQGMTAGQSGQNGGLLDQLGKNLSHAANAGLIDPVIGRDAEVERVIETLNRRNKNNPVLIGEPGVGKTAIAEGLALRIAEGEVPRKLKNKQIYLLDVSSLVTNTGIRGQFEERMKQLIKEMQERKDVIVFIDEIHQLVGAGSAEGSSDAGNILKPALARGEIQVIGATTLKEYRQIEKDAALERRFQPVMVNEPTIEEAVRILEGLRENYEKYHGVRYTDEAIRACVTLSNRYIQDRFLPDKAIDLMDEAGSKVNLIHETGGEAELRDRLEQIAAEKEEATRKEEYERAARLRDEEQQLEAKLKEAGDGGQAKNAVVDVETIQQIVENKTGIPVRKLQKDEQEKMKNLSERLNSQVIGQGEAVRKVAKAIRRNRAGLRRGNRPIGSFLFVGPTGVGKTELARSLARELFGSEDSMIRLDMSEYMEKHSVSKLIGSPPGYVGHEEAGQLTERVRRKPYSIILLDEIEKAHPDVQHMFLQIMEDGRLTDSQGRTVSFKDTVLIMTSNAGVGVKKASIGFGKDPDTPAPTDIDTLTDYFRPEFLNRFDGIIPFRALDRNDLVQIVELMLKDVHEAAEEQGLTLTVTEDAKTKLAELGHSPSFGARPLRRVIEERVEDGIADLLLEEEDVKAIVVDVEDGDITVRKAN
ncbi:ATP-dependent Clp protease ATP-binding subunit ClpE [Melghirimyces profundicolus]|uniref:ATP-dependent Clp protease ATP-binding subunit ClpE n=1 Tax=Melghirimyces profundicolus TaxID=1242148 RepID=A0A2T6C908_9BACL|nr:ATP-dependent Clp protease ATP-binding subunit [Melghirimyces profundicolus]PTX64799.1 ATP-dependent Clp protease ATP-binding subunit ClpE [Melghirimyces profundicolus]